MYNSCMLYLFIFPSSFPLDEDKNVNFNKDGSGVVNE